MVKYDITNSTDSQSYLVKRHFISFGFIAILLLAAGFLFYTNIQENLDHFHIHGMARNQQFLVQRATFLATRMTEQPDAKIRYQLRKELLETIGTLWNNHLYLSTAHADQDDTGPRNNPDADRLYFHEPANIDGNMQEFVHHAYNIVSSDDSALTSDNADFTGMVRQTTPLVKNLYAALEAHTNMSKTHLQREMYIGFTAIGGIIFALLFEMLFIFMPMGRTLSIAYEQLKRASRMKSEFLANMSHEIRTPINAIMGIGELLLGSTVTSKQSSQLQTLLTATDSLLVIINDILDFSKIEAGKLDLEHIPFDLYSAAEDVAELLGHKARAKRLELIVHYEPGTPQYVIGDPGRVRQIISNFVSNAIKFTDTGYVLISIGADAHQPMNAQHCMIRVKVEDTGIGISQEAQARIFDKFTQADGSTTRKFGGTGLGLTICQQLTELMHGKVGVESQEGKGSVFWFSMELGRAPRVGKFESSHGILNQKRILVVDDLLTNRTLLRDILSGVGIQVSLASGAREGLQMLQDSINENQPFDMAIIDYLMPEVDGESLAKSIRSDARLRDIPVAVLSSAGEKGFIKIFSDIGVAAYLSKPVRKKLLLDTLSMVLDNKARGITTELLTSHSLTMKTQNTQEDDDKPLVGARILLTEDNQTNRELTKEVLLNMGCIVDCAEDGYIAVDKISSHQYDIVLMDCQMPGIDGFEATRRIIAMRKERGMMDALPIIALTANAMERDRERCFQAGMDDYLSKPVRRANLETTLVRWISRKANRQKAEAKQETSPLPSIAIINPRPDMTMPDNDIGTSNDDTRVPTLDIATNSHIDQEVFKETRQLVGARFETLMSCYLTDADDYLQRIQHAIANHEPYQNITLPAHTLKSSSRQFGFIHLSDYAEKLEKLSENAGQNPRTTATLRTLLDDANVAFKEVRDYVGIQPANKAAR